MVLKQLSIKTTRFGFIPIKILSNTQTNENDLNLFVPIDKEVKIIDSKSPNISTTFLTVNIFFFEN